MLNPTINATHVEESGTLLEGDEVRDINCENNYVLDFIVEPLRDPGLLLHYYSTLITLSELKRSQPYKISNSSKRSQQPLYYHR